MSQQFINGKTLVNGFPVYGKTTQDKAWVNENSVFVTKDLEMGEYEKITLCAAVICENAGKTSHITMMCRIRGIPIIRIDNIDEIFIGKEVTIDFTAEKVYLGCVELPNQAFDLKKQIWPQNLTYQLSIVEPDDIYKANQVKDEDANIFFLRSEFIWVLKQKEPFLYLIENGLSETISFLVNCYLPFATAIFPSQYLNIRSLDMRSDEFDVFDTPLQVEEPNPQLGLHGIRQLLSKPRLLIAELLAIDALYALGYKNIIFSLPFVMDENEICRVKEIIDLCCDYEIKLGIFVETPAVINELPHILSQNLVDFIFVGTKDLTQLVLGVDRSNSAVSHLYDTCKRSVLLSIQAAIDACYLNSIPVSIFSLAEDIPHYAKNLNNVSKFSLCSADYIRQKAA